MPCRLIRSPGCRSVWHRVCVQEKPAVFSCSRSSGRGPRATSLLHRRRGRKIEPAVQLQRFGKIIRHDSDWRQSTLCSRRQAECNDLLDAPVAVGMRLRGRDLEDSTVSWIPSVLGVQSVRLRLRLDRRDDRGRSLWQLVDLGEEVQSGRRPRDRTPPTCSQNY